jgi:hypothetical protein
MENAPRAIPLRFSDFAEPGGPLDGKKVKIDEILNMEVLILACSMKESKYQRTSAKDCLTLQFEYLDKPGEKHVVFTGSNVLIDQLKKYEDKLPFMATIKKIDRYYTLS